MIETLAEKLKAAGFGLKDIQQFDIFSIPDELIIFPEERLGQTRRKHQVRLVIVLQNNRDNSDPTIKLITIAPLSQSPQHHRLDYLLKKADHQFLKGDSFIRIRHIQPILKVDLKSKFGKVIQNNIRDDIRDRLFILYNLQDSL